MNTLIKNLRKLSKTMEQKRRLSKFNIFNASLFVSASIFAISLLLAFLDLGGTSAAGRNFLCTLGKFLFGAYGYSSIFIPIFFLVAALQMIGTTWSLKRGVVLAGSLLPFFTIVAIEHICRIFLENGNGIVLGIKITSTLLFGLIAFCGEYVLLVILGDVLQDRFANKKFDFDNFDESEFDSQRTADMQKFSDAENLSNPDETKSMILDDMLEKATEIEPSIEGDSVLDFVRNQVKPVDLNEILFKSAEREAREAKLRESRKDVFEEPAISEKSETFGSTTISEVPAVETNLSIEAEPKLFSEIVEDNDESEDFWDSEADATAFDEKDDEVEKDYGIEKDDGFETKVESVENTEKKENKFAHIFDAVENNSEVKLSTWKYEDAIRKILPDLIQESPRSNDTVGEPVLESSTTKNFSHFDEIEIQNKNESAGEDNLAIENDNSFDVVEKKLDAEDSTFVDEMKNNLQKISEENSITETSNSFNESEYQIKNEEIVEEKSDVEISNSFDDSENYIENATEEKADVEKADIEKADIEDSDSFDKVETQLDNEKKNEQKVVSADFKRAADIFLSMDDDAAENPVLKEPVPQMQLSNSLPESDEALKNEILAYESALRKNFENDENDESDESEEDYVDFDIDAAWDNSKNSSSVEEVAENEEIDEDDVNDEDENKDFDNQNRSLNRSMDIVENIERNSEIEDEDEDLEGEDEDLEDEDEDEDEETDFVDEDYYDDETESDEDIEDDDGVNFDIDNAWDNPKKAPSVEDDEDETPQIDVYAASNNKIITPEKVFRKGPYEIPFDLLENYPGNDYWVVDEETRLSGAKLKSTLSEFKIDVEITGIRKGPAVTMYELLPAPGVKLSKIESLQDNIALDLAASSVRIVAPIPGKHAVGIEVPNKKRAIVGFKELIEKNMSDFETMSIPVVLGKDISGDPQMIDLAKTPHLLIAGSTGAGKSVCVNTMLLSILYKRRPDQVKLVLVDPKVVEMKLYNDIPHLLTPVITEAKRALQALQYCLCEMERRYALLANMNVREIRAYNKKIETEHIATEKLPYIVVVIDEFADLMMTTGKELETVIARLAAKSRAIGIHLVLATQRPSTDVITGIIKANLPSRIAFMVASQMDSRVILDKSGAENLLGKGDMLYIGSTSPFPTRIQGTLVGDDEVERVVEYVKSYGEPEYIDEEIFVDEEEEENDNPSLFGEDEDPLYDQALQIVVQSGKASASYIQRRLKIGYNRAARLVEEMEERGIVGPANGSKPREIIHMP